MTHCSQELSPWTRKERKEVRRMLLAIVLCVVFIIAEVIGGYLAHSLAVMTDAAHMASDLISFAVSVTAIYLSKRPPTETHSFGFHRAEILGALTSISLIWAVTAILLYEAVMRIITPEDVDGRLMFFVATGGVLVNFAMLALLGGHHGHGHSHGHSPGHGGHAHSHAEPHVPLADAEIGNPLNAHAGSEVGGENEMASINMRAAIIHVIGDLCQSIGVMIAGAIIWAKPEARIADPICTFVFSVLVIWTTRRVLLESTKVLMESTPAHIDPAAVAKSLLAIDGVLDVHDLHIWSITSGKPILCVHLHVFGTDEPAVGSSPAVVDVDQCPKQDCELGPTVLDAARDRLRTEFGIYHTTIQIEHAPRPCFVPVVDPSAALATATASEYTAVSP